MGARVHAVAFLESVFNEASKDITNLRVEGLDRHNQTVNLFSKYMSEGMNCGSHGENRLSFYDNVVSGAIHALSIMSVSAPDLNRLAAGRENR